MAEKEKVTQLSGEQYIKDYRLGYRSRQASIIGRREVLTGKAKFGIFGDGKELIQLAIARSFKKGDWRSGYYRDQTWMMAVGLLTLEQFFAELYAHADPNADPNSGGRNMPGHFSSQLIDKDGEWLNQTELFNSAADLASTGSQMPRLVGLAYSSVLYRKLNELKPFKEFSHHGDEVAWGSIGNASTAEGMFWEAVNAIGVLHAPAVISVYDDGYGISVPNKFQMVKENIYSILKGFERVACPAEDCDRGFSLYSVEAWNYPSLLETYQQAAIEARKYHIPALIHVVEATQPLGHSTSGSQERYKSKERLQWEFEHDGLKRYRKWLVDHDVASNEQLTAWEKEDNAKVEQARKHAWEAFQGPIRKLRAEVLPKLEALIQENPNQEVSNALAKLSDLPDLIFRDVAETMHLALVLTRGHESPTRKAVESIAQKLDKEKIDYYTSFLLSNSEKSPLKQKGVPAIYSDSSPMVMGFEVLNKGFDEMLKREPRMIAFGEDVGNLGDVNQGFHGMQEKYGPLRVSDTGIREATIIGQGIGMALRGLRPIAELQYLDYLTYALQIMADDLANLRWRTAGRQQAPLIIRTRGHRLEGIFHSGSPMAGILNLVRGIHVLVPRNMTQAVGFYNTLIESDDPALVVEVLNGYRLKERMPDNISEFKLPLGIPEILRKGKDISIVTYGASVRIALEAAKLLQKTGVDAELIDVQSLLPFDLHGTILDSIKKTSRVLFVDEDVPGGTTAYMLQQVLEKQGGYVWLDSAPVTLPGAEHRPAYGSDGDYYSKPNAETIFDAAYAMLREADPAHFPAIRQGE